MHRVSLFWALLAVTVIKAQNGYEYNRPGKPFNAANQQRPGSKPLEQNSGYPSSVGFPSSYPSSATTSPFPSGAQNDDIPETGNTQSGPSNNYPSRPNQGQSPAGYPNAQRPGQVANYPGQSGQSGNYQGTPGQAASGPNANYPSQSNVPGTSGQGVSSPGNNYPGQGKPIAPAGQYPDQYQNYPAQAAGGAIVQAGPGVPPSGFGQQQDTGAYEGGDYSAIPGEPERDYPILSEIPETSFKCESQQYPGYYADVETRCQVFHICANNITYDFLCPNGTIFSQQVFVCVWWNQFDCNSAPGLYELNAQLYSGAKPNEGSGPSNNYYQGMQGGVPAYPGNAGSQNDFPNSGPQGPYGNKPGSAGPQGPSGYPGNAGSQGSPGSAGSQGPSGGYPGSAGPQAPSGSYPGSAGSQGQPGSYPGSAGSQGPSGGYPGSAGSQGPSGGYPGSAGPQVPSGSYPGSVGTQGQPGSYPGSAGSQGPSGSYPGNAKPQGPSNGYQGSSGPNRPSNNLIGNAGAQGPSGNNKYPGSNSASYPGNQGNLSDGNQGYPSGKPKGPSFPLGYNERPNGAQRPQSDTGASVNQPNREYLPPRN